MEIKGPPNHQSLEINQHRVVDQKSHQFSFGRVSIQLITKYFSPTNMEEVSIRAISQLLESFYYFPSVNLDYRLRETLLPTFFVVWRPRKLRFFVEINNDFKFPIKSNYWNDTLRPKLPFRPTNTSSRLLLQNSKYHVKGIWKNKFINFCFFL